LKSVAGKAADSQYSYADIDFEKSEVSAGVMEVVAEVRRGNDKQARHLVGFQNFEFL